MAKRALITGITGQDGSYLAELLLGKGYEVHGLVRRLSVPNTANIEGVMDKVTLHDGDLADQGSLHRVVREAEPKEVYNLAAQSFVHTSFAQPVLTFDITGTGALRMLEAVRAEAPEARYYQAGSSEMFGKVHEVPQRETTRFHPRSPYAVAKVAAHDATVNYREAYGMFASNGILFNHECVTAETPVIIRRRGLLDCVPIADVLPDPSHVRQRELDLEVWDKGGFAKAKLGTANWNSPSNDRRVHRVMVRSGEVRATADHVLIQANGREMPTSEVAPGHRLLRIELPDPPGRTSMTPAWARLLGLMSAEGSATYSVGKYSAHFRNNDPKLLNEVQRLWEETTGGHASDSPGVSGFTDEPTGGLALFAERGILHYLHDVLYTEQRFKRVPRTVLNADAATWRAFLSGYNAGDGLKAGHGAREFKNFKTSSPVLAAGLWWMASRLLDQKLTLNVDFVHRGEYGERQYAYYSINLGTEGGPKKGRHLLKDPDEVKRVLPEPYTGWLFDIETDSGTFHAGVGDLLIHNSPRRGLEFVTRKISHAVARVHAGLDKKLVLGNLDARRDWGYAPEYVEGMWRMLQHDEPGDFVLATGQNHTVRDFVERAFDVAGIKGWEKLVKTDKAHLRPAEVVELLGDASKARKTLGWKPRTTFGDLVRIMVEADLARLEGKRSRRGG